MIQCLVGDQRIIILTSVLICKYTSFPSFQTGTGSSVTNNNNITTEVDCFVLCDVSITAHISCSTKNLIYLLPTAAATVAMWSVGPLGRCSEERSQQFLHNNVSCDNASAYLAGQALGAVVSRQPAFTLVIVSENGFDKSTVKGEVTLIGVICAAVQCGWRLQFIGGKDNVDENFTRLHTAFPWFG